MPRPLDKRVKELFAKHDINPRDACWDCHGTWVVYHRYCEIIAIKEGITFDQPLIVESDAAKQIVVLCVTGRIGDFSAWSFGEAAPYNLKGAKGFPYAMAEKRAKDRVILKLAGIHGLVYSEEEADDFKPKRRAPAEKPNESWTKKTPASVITSDQQAVTRALGGLYKKLISVGITVEKVNEVWREALDAAGAESKHDVTVDNIDKLRDYINKYVIGMTGAFKSK